MNGELRRLLVEAGYQRARETDAWDSVIVLGNYGSIPAPSWLPLGHAQKGFSLLLLDRGGRPEHLARCGRANDRAFELQSRIQETLSAVPELMRTIPRTRSACSSLMRVQLTAFVPGRSYYRLARRDDPGAWVRTSCEILEVSARVCASAQSAFPELRAEGEQVVLADAIAAMLPLLSGAGIPSTHLDALVRAVSPIPPLKATTQHGDLWPANVLRYQGSWWLLDFAEFGQARVPMYDVFHMVRYNPGRGDYLADHAWLSLGEGAVDDDWTRAARQVVARSAQSLGLSPREAAAALVYYLVHLSCYRLRPGVPPEYQEPFLRELFDTADLLRQGTTLEDLVVPCELTDR